jgi:hypothetical protein
MALSAPASAAARVTRTRDVSVKRLRSTSAALPDADSTRNAEFPAVAHLNATAHWSSLLEILAQDVS